MPETVQEPVQIHHRGPLIQANLAPRPGLRCESHRKELVRASVSASRALGNGSRIRFVLSGGHVRLREHLSDDFAADARVGAAFSLDEGRDTVFVEEEVVDAPPRPGVGIVSRADFPCYAKPAVAARAILVPARAGRTARSPARGRDATPIPENPAPMTATSTSGSSDAREAGASTTGWHSRIMPAGGPGPRSIVAVGHRAGERAHVYYRARHHDRG